MKRWVRGFLMGAGAAATTPAYALTLDCAQGQAREYSLTLPAELEVSPHAPGQAFVIADERGVDVVIERIDAAGARAQYDLPPADWSSTVIALPAGTTSMRLRVTSLLPTRTQAALRVALWCEGTTLPAAQVEILRALDAAARAVTEAGDTSLSGTARQQVRDRALALLGGVALASARIPELTWVRAQALHTQGYLYNQSARSADSARTYADAAQAWRAAGDGRRALWAELRQAQQWSRRGETSKALRAYERIAADELARDQAKLLGVATNDRCFILTNLQRLDEAAACYAQALAIYDAAGERGEYALTLANAADVALERGEPSQARTDARRALDQARELRMARPHALAALVLGKTERLLGNLDSATELYLEAESAAQRPSDHNLRANAHRQLSSVMALRGDWSRAESYGRTAHDGYARGEYWPGAALALLDVAQAQYQRGKLADATASALQAIDLVERHQLDVVRANALLVRAELCVAQADSACAQAAMMAFDHAPGAQDHARAARAQQVLAGIQAMRGDISAARRTLTRALARARRAGDWFAEIRIGERLGALRLAQGDARGALTELDAALARREQLARNQVLPARMGSYTQDEREALDSHLRARREAQGSTPAAIRARLQLLRRMQSTLGEDGPRDTATTAEAAVVLQDLAAAVRAHWELDAPISRDAPSVQDLITRLERLRAAPDADAATVPSAEPAFERANAAHTLVMFVGPRGVWRWWIDGARVDEHLGAAPDVLGEHAASLVRLAHDATSGAAALRAAAQHVRADLALTDVRWDANAEVTIVADGALNALPWRLVLEGDSEGPAPVLNTALTQQIAPHPSPCCAGAALYAFADPTVVGLGSSAAPATPTRTLARLPGSRAEANAAARIWGAARSTVYLGAEATRARALEALRAEHAVVHFATHGLIDASVPDLSGLLVVDGERLGLLAWHDILAQSAQAQLVVLGACEAGGGAARGHGSPSLAQAFVHAGAQQVIAPLWPISDAASMRFMDAFYRALADGARPTAALAAAQQHMRSDTRYAHPYYWAGFISLTQGAQ
jgi:tetratricopeptide (TPR) repeat protein